MAKGEQQPRKGPGFGKPTPGKQPTHFDKPGLSEDQLGKVAGGRSSQEEDSKKKGG
jgi:hypothetical protein